MLFSESGNEQNHAWISRKQGRRGRARICLGLSSHLPLSTHQVQTQTGSLCISCLSGSLHHDFQLPCLLRHPTLSFPLKETAGSPMSPMALWLEITHEDSELSWPFSQGPKLLTMIFHIFCPLFYTCCIWDWKS